MHVIDQAIPLEHYRHLFKDERSFTEFVAVLTTTCNKGSTVLFADGKIVGTLLSSGGTKELLYERFLKKISEKPDLLAEIADRLENDEVVE